MQKLITVLFTLAITLNFGSFGCNKTAKLEVTKPKVSKPEAAKPKAAKPKAVKPEGPSYVIVQPKSIKRFEKPMTLASIKAEAQKMLNKKLAKKDKECKKKLSDCKKGKESYYSTYSGYDRYRYDDKGQRLCSPCSAEDALQKAVKDYNGAAFHSVISPANYLRGILVFQHIHDMVGKELCQTMKQIHSPYLLHTLSTSAVSNAKKFYKELKRINSESKLLRRRGLRNLPLPPVGTCKRVGKGKYVWRYNSTPSYLMR